jgi:hypothetical protein
MPYVPLSESSFFVGHIAGPLPLSPQASSAAVADAPMLEAYFALTFALIIAHSKGTSRLRILRSAPKMGSGKPKTRSPFSW